MKFIKILKSVSFICFLIISYAGKGQNFYLYNVNTSKTRTISSLKNIRVDNGGRNDLKLKGEAVMLNDSIVSINDTLVHINDITIIQAVTNKSIQSGIILSFVSAGLITLGVVISIQTRNVEGIGVLSRFIVSLAIYGAVSNTLFHSIENLILGKKYRQKSGWTLRKIKKEILSPTEATLSP